MELTSPRIAYHDVEDYFWCFPAVSLLPSSAYVDTIISAMLLGELGMAADNFLGPRLSAR